MYYLKKIAFAMILTIQFFLRYLCFKNSILSSIILKDYCVHWNSATYAKTATFEFYILYTWLPGNVESWHSGTSAEIESNYLNTNSNGLRYMWVLHNRVYFKSNLHQRW